MKKLLNIAGISFLAVIAIFAVRAASVQAEEFICPKGWICKPATSAVSGSPYISSAASKASLDGEIYAGESVGIKGTSLAVFPDKTRVYINNIECPITQIDNTLIYCKAPSSLKTGNTYDLWINTIADGGKDSSNIVKVKVVGSGTVTTSNQTTSITISNVTSKASDSFEVWANETAVVSGKNFGAARGAYVMVGDKKVKITSADDTVFNVRMPKDLVTGNYYPFYITDSNDRVLSNMVRVRVLGSISNTSTGSNDSSIAANITNITGKATEDFEAWANDSMVISGTRMTYGNGTRVFIGGKEAVITQISDSLIIATVPNLKKGSYQFYLADNDGKVKSNKVKVRVMVSSSNTLTKPSTSVTKPIDISGLPRVYFTKLPERPVLTVGDKLYWGWAVENYPNYQASRTNNSVDYLDLYLVPTDGSERIKWATNFWVHEPNQPQYINITERTVKNSKIVGKEFKIRIECQSRNVTSKTCAAESKDTYVITDTMNAKPLKSGAAAGDIETTGIWAKIKGLFQ